MKENKFVTWEMFQKYHELLVGHIKEQDGLDPDDETSDANEESENHITEE